MDTSMYQINFHVHYAILFVKVVLHLKKIVQNVMEIGIF